MEEQLFEMISKISSAQAVELHHIRTTVRYLKKLQAILEAIQKDSSFLENKEVIQFLEEFTDDSLPIQKIEKMEAILARKKKPSLFQQRKITKQHRDLLKKVSEDLQGTLSLGVSKKEEIEHILELCKLMQEGKEKGIPYDSVTYTTFYTNFLTDDDFSEYHELIFSHLRETYQKVLAEHQRLLDEEAAKEKKESVPILIAPSEPTLPNAHIAPMIEEVFDVPLDYARELCKYDNFHLLKTITREKYASTLIALLYQVEIEVFMIQEEMKTLDTSSVDYVLLQELFQELRQEEETIKEHLPKEKEAVLWKQA